MKDNTKSVIIFAIAALVIIGALLTTLDLICVEHKTGAFVSKEVLNYGLPEEMEGHYDWGSITPLHLFADADSQVLCYHLIFEDGTFYTLEVDTPYRLSLITHRSPLFGIESHSYMLEAPATSVYMEVVPTC